jgi:hypothetical protein
MCPLVIQNERPIHQTRSTGFGPRAVIMPVTWSRLSESNRRPIHYEIVSGVVTICCSPGQVPCAWPLSACERPLRRVCSGTNLARLPSSRAFSVCRPDFGEPLFCKIHSWCPAWSVAWADSFRESVKVRRDPGAWCQLWVSVLGVAVLRLSPSGWAAAGVWGVAAHTKLPPDWQAILRLAGYALAPRAARRGHARDANAMA